MSKRKPRIHVFGYFGFVTNQLDGQTVKTRSICNLLIQKADANITFSDSQSFRYSLKSIIKFFKEISRCDTLIWLPAHNNLKYLFPLIWFWSKICRFDIIYIVIGGWLSSFFENLSFHRSKLKKIKGILLENHLAKQELHDKFGFTNLNIIPNFRATNPKPEISVDSTKLRIVFMARINKMKGLDSIANIAPRLNPNNTIIDFYGPIHDADKEYFMTELCQRYPFIEYRGVLQPDKIYTTLSEYDVMLFPTHYYTEGFPGSIMDAYRSAVPVIATNWKHANEFIVNEKTGFIVNFDTPEDEMVTAIEMLFHDRERLRKMKDYAYEESLRYTPETAWQILRKYI